MLAYDYVEFFIKKNKIIIKKDKNTHENFKKLNENADLLNGFQKEYLKYENHLGKPEHLDKYISIALFVKYYSILDSNYSKDFFKSLYNKISSIDKISKKVELKNIMSDINSKFCIDRQNYGFLPRTSTIG